MSDRSVQPGAVYRSAKPADQSFHVQITGVNATSAVAVDPDGRPRRIPLRQLHANPKTELGFRRRGGYVLVQPGDGSAA